MSKWPRIQASVTSAPSRSIFSRTGWAHRPPRGQRHRLPQGPFHELQPEGLVAAMAGMVSPALGVASASAGPEGGGLRKMPRSDPQAGSPAARRPDPREKEIAHVEDGYRHQQGDHGLTGLHGAVLYKKTEGQRQPLTSGTGSESIRMGPAIHSPDTTCRRPSRSRCPGSRRVRACSGLISGFVDVIIEPDETIGPDPQ